MPGYLMAMDTRSFGCSPAQRIVGVAVVVSIYRRGWRGYWVKLGGHASCLNSTQYRAKSSSLPQLMNYGVCQKATFNNSRTRGS